MPFEPSFDYTRDGILKSYEMSLARLGLNRVEALLIHDLDLRFHKSEEGVDFRLGQLDDGGYRALADLKAAGEIAAIGAGINLKGMIPRFLQRWPLDFFLVAMPYTLLEQEGLKELEMCAARGVAIVIGAPYASGILVRGPGPGALYRYAPAEPAIIAKAQRVAEVCRRHAVPLAAAALQFWPPQRRLRDPRAGCRRRSTPEPRLDATRPHDDLWAELKAEGLVRAEAPTPRLAGSP